MKKITIYLIISILSWYSCTSQPWVKADSLRVKYLLAGRYDSALYYADEAAAIMRGNSGENNLQYAGMLNNLAITQNYLGNFKKARYYILKEAALRESLKATENVSYINCLAAASVICRKSGSYEDALTQMKKAEKKALSVYDTDTPEYAAILDHYAGVYHDLGCSVNDMVYLKQEEKYLKRAEAIYLKNAEKTKSEYIINKTDQASYNNNIGNSPQAELMFQDVVVLCRKEYGPESTGYASALNNLAVLYFNTGNYKLAEKYLVEAVALYKKSAPESVRTGICINNLGALYHEIGNYKVAEKLVSETKQNFERNFQQNSPYYAVVLNNLAAVSLSEDYYASPENKDHDKLLNSGKVLLKADSVFMINCQKPHPMDLSIISNLAIWYSITGNTKKSMEIANSLVFDSNVNMRLVSMMNKMGTSGQLPGSSYRNIGPEPVLIPVSINLIDQVSASNMTNSSASGDAVTNAIIRLFMGKAANIKKAVGPYHPSYAKLLKSLIVVYAANDDVRTEEELTLEYIDVLNHKTLQDFSFLSDSEKEFYYQTRLPEMHSFIEYTLLRKRENPAITCNAYNNILLNKGLMLKSSTAMRLAILNSNDPELLKKYDEWIALQREISVLYATPVELRTSDVSTLESRANALEKSLVATSQDFSDYRKGLQITWEDVRKSLKPDEAAIEFTDFRVWKKDGGNAVVYCALVVRPDSKYPEMIRLFTEDQLEKIISNEGMNDLGRVNEIYGSAGRSDDRLYNLIWKPVEQYLQGAKSIFISPSGLLYKISFPSISNGKNVYLCDAYRLQVKGSTGNFTVQNIFSAEQDASALVFGGIRYSHNNSDLQVWNYLEGTKNEGDAINGILSGGSIKVSYLTDNKATEAFFKQNAGQHNVLHIATHGFFFDDPNKVRFEEKKSEEVEYGQVTFRGAPPAATMGFGIRSFVNNDNPLMRSGLVLAGANDVWVKKEKEEAEDGVLTAQEVTQIDMRKNDLVVLSACETGLGDIRGSEGVYGLQRALKMAGVKYIIMSLWQIPDKETVEFMGAFYKNLLSIKDIRGAFFEAQKEMRQKYDPYYWGAFVLMD